jgi:hypothetical protein
MNRECTRNCASKGHQEKAQPRMNTNLRRFRCRLPISPCATENVTEPEHCFHLKRRAQAANRNLCNLRILPFSVVVSKRSFLIRSIPVFICVNLRPSAVKVFSSPFIRVRSRPFVALLCGPAADKAFDQLRQFVAVAAFQDRCRGNIGFA